MNELESLKSLKEQVRKVLAMYTQTRNNDVDLTLAVWVTFYSNHLIYDEEKKVWQAPLREIRRLPREDNIKRVRAIIQNEEGLYLPTDPDVARKRKLYSKSVRKNIHKI